MPTDRFANQIPRYDEAVVTTHRDDHPALARTLEAELRKQRLIMAEGLLAGQAKDFPDYRNLIGKIEGLDIAIALAKKVQEKLDA